MQMQGDGPRVRDGYDDGPYTFAEIVACCDDHLDVCAAAAFARRWPEGVPEADLSLWQRIGPELVWFIERGDDSALHKIGPLVTDRVSSLRWVREKRLSRIQIELAVSDELDGFRNEAMPASISALRVGCRKDTFLKLRWEAKAIIVWCFCTASFEMMRALGMRE